VQVSAERLLRKMCTPLVLSISAEYIFSELVVLMPRMGLQLQDWGHLLSDRDDVNINSMLKK